MDEIRERVLSNPVAFEFGLPDFLRLTQAGVSDDVLLAMMGSSPPGPEDLQGARAETLQREVERLWEQYFLQRDRAEESVARAVQFFALRKEQVLQALHSPPPEEEPVQSAPQPPDPGQ